MCANWCVMERSHASDRAERANCGFMGGKTLLDMLIEFIYGYVCLLAMGTGGGTEMAMVNMGLGVNSSDFVGTVSAHYVTLRA